jgi:hypothetical protein
MAALRLFVTEPFCVPLVLREAAVITRDLGGNPSRLEAAVR